MVIKQFKFKSQIQNQMSKRQDNNSKNSFHQTVQNPHPNSDSHREEILRTPVKKHEQKIGEQVFKFMEPFPLPPKINNQFTASSNGNCSYGQDMKVIQTPYSHQNRLFVHHQIQDMNEELGPITNKIHWQQTPARNEQSSSLESDESENLSDNCITSESIKSKQSSNQSESSQQENTQKHSQQPNKKFTTQKIQREKQFSKRINNQKKLLEQLALQQSNNGSSKKVFCNCKKTKCLKLYCDCFRVNQTCDGCNCDGCRNLQQFEQERNNAILVLMQRNSDPFSQKIYEDKHMKGCNCKKSFCLKKYCECYQAGLKCGDNCKCDQCKNGGGSEKRQRDRLEKEAVQKKQQVDLYQ